MYIRNRRRFETRNGACKLYALYNIIFTLCIGHKMQVWNPSEERFHLGLGDHCEGNLWIGLRIGSHKGSGNSHITQCRESYYNYMFCHFEA